MSEDLTVTVAYEWLSDNKVVSSEAEVSAYKVIEDLIKHIERLDEALDLLFHTLDFKMDYQELPEEVKEAYRIAHTALSHPSEWEQERVIALREKLFGPFVGGN